MLLRFRKPPTPKPLPGQRRRVSVYATLRDPMKRKGLFVAISE